MGIYTFKNAKLTELGLWLRSEGGKEEIYLEPGEARALAEQIIAQTARPAIHQGSAAIQRSAPVAQRSSVSTHRSAPTTRRPAAPARKSAPAPTLPNQVTGTVQYVGKSSFTDPKWADHAKGLAKQRAMKKLENCLQGLKAEGKAWNTPKITAQHFVNGGDVSYVVRADFA